MQVGQPFFVIKYFGTRTNMLNLARPNFIDRNVTVIVNQLVDRYEEITQKRLYPAQPERLLIDLLAYCIYLLREQIQNASEQNLVQYAQGIILEHHAAFYGILRLSALKSKTVLKFTAEPGTSNGGARPVVITIPEGAQIRTKDGKQIFQTLTAIEISLADTEATVEAEALVATSAANDYPLGEVSESLTSIAWINSIGNTVVTHSGADAESDTQLRERIVKAPESFSTAGPTGAYIFFALSAHPAIIDVAAETNLPGTVQVYPLTTGGAPSQEVIDAVKAMLSDEKRRPVCDTVSVLQPTAKTFTIDVNVTLYAVAQSIETKAVIEARLAEYADEKRKKLGRDIVQAHIITLIQSVTGVYNVALVQPATIPVAASEYADCTAITVHLLAPVNEEPVTYRYP